MTEEEKDRLRRAKAEVTAMLAALPISNYRLGDIDARLEQYVREVADNPDGHNLYEQLAVLRFFRMADKYGINATEVRRFFTLYENLHFPGTVFGMKGTAWCARQCCLYLENLARPRRAQR